MTLRRVAIAGIGDSGEALLLRALLEAMGAEVRLTMIGKPSAISGALTMTGAVPDLAILSAHGDERGLIFPELAPGVDPLMPADGRLGPDWIARHLVVPETTLLVTACASGAPATASALLKAGAARVVAPPGYPAGHAIGTAVAVMAHGVAHRGLSWNEATSAAVKIGGDDAEFAVLSA